MKRLTGLLLASGIAALLLTDQAAAQSYLVPRPEGSALDSCTTCNSAYLGLPSYPFPTSAIKAFAGRFMDSTATQDYQQPLRTWRARQLKYSPTNQRFYGMYGSSVVAFSEANFMARLSEPLEQQTRTSGGEQYLRPDASFYAESGGWDVPLVDGQIRLFDVEFDDRGYVYPAYGIFGWGVLQDSGGATLESIKQMKGVGTAGNPTMALWFKSGASHYLAVAGSSSAYDIWDVTTPSNPTLVRSGAVSGARVRQWARTPDGGRIIISSGVASVDIYTASEFVSGTAPTNVTSTRGIFLGVAADSVGFWVGEEITSSNDSWGLLRVEAGTNAVTVHDVPYELLSGSTANRFKPYVLTYGANFIGAAGSGSATSASTALVSVAGSTAIPVHIEQWFQNYYYSAPSGYARPPGYAGLPCNILPHRYGAQTYFMYSGYGLGDVFKIGHPGLAISDATVTEGNAGTTEAHFTVTMAASESTVTVQFDSVDGTATAGSDYTAVTGTLTFAPGEITKDIAVVVAGDTLDELDEVFGVTLSNASGAPISVAEGVGTIYDDEPKISIDDVSVDEGDTGTVNAEFRVTLSSSSASVVSVNYATAGETASSGADFVSVVGTVTFAPGETEKSIGVPVNGDAIDESDETFAVALSDPSNAMIRDGNATGTIRDDETARLRIDDVTVTELQNGPVAAQFNVSLSVASALTITVQFETEDGSATGSSDCEAIVGSDYVASSGSLTFNPGETTKSITIPVREDSIAESDEEFYVYLSNPANAAFDDFQGTATIIDVDEATIRISDAAVIEGNSGATEAQFTLTLSSPSSSAVSVDYLGSSRSATIGADFGTPSGTLTWTPGETEKVLSVSVTGDIQMEPDETFVITLSNATNATIADSQAFGTIVNDEEASISIDDVTVTEGNSGPQNASFTVSLSAERPSTVTVQYATANGTATAGSDYTAASGTLTFSPGELTKTLVVTVLGDTASEGTESFVVNLTNPTNTTIQDGQGTGTIADDDAVLLIVSPASTTQVNLSWTYFGTGHTGFKIERRLTTATSWTLIAATNTPGVTTYASAGLTACTGYVYRVRAYTGVVNGAYSNEAAATTTGCLAAPTELSATTVSATQVNLSWSYAGSGQTGFKIERRLASATAWSQVALIATPAARTYSNTSGLTACASYVYRIRAYIGTTQNGLYSNEASATTTGCLATPSGLAATGASNTQITLSWSYAGTGHSGFKIERRIRGNAAWAQVAATTTPGTTTYASIALVVCTEYEYRVRAYSGTTNNGPYSSEATGATLGCITAPTGLVATSQSATSIRLTWSYAGSGHTGFKLERRLATATSWAQIAATTTAGTLSYTSTALTGCRQYVYRVRAYKSTTANSLFTNEATATTTCP